jgi:signal transduction histidine kinase/ActR/RegA family two-component response regulator
MPMQKKILALVFILSALTAFAQDYHNTDSLQRELQKFEAHKKLMGSAATPLMDTTKANWWYELVRAYWCLHSDSGMDYARQCMELSEKIGYKKGIGNAYNGMGIILICRRNSKQALAYLDTALKIRMEINDQEGMAWTYNNMGLAYGDEGNYPLSIISHTNALKIWEDIGDKTFIEASFSKRGTAYELLGDYPSAVKDYLNALKAAAEEGSKQRVADEYNVLGRIYDKMGNYPEAQKNYLNSSKLALEIGDKAYIALTHVNLGEVCYKQRDFPGALNNYLYALKIREEIDYTIYEIADVHNKIALVYFMEHKYPEALKNCFSALKIYENLKEKYGMAFSYNLLGNIYEKQKNYTEALKYQTKSLEIATETNVKDIKKSAYESLASINAGMQNYKAAYQNEVLFKQVYDSLYNKENERKLTGLQMQFEFNKQQDSIQAEQLKKDNIAQQQIRRQKAYLGIGIAGFIFLGTLLFFVFNSYRNQRKATAAMALAKMRAEQSEKFKEKFLANMSHEIRTPMNAVLGMANLVLDRPLDDKQRGYVAGIKKSSENLLVILNDILDLSKLEAGKMHLEMAPFKVHEQVTHVMDIMRFKADEKGLAFTADIAGDVPSIIIGDAARLNAVLLNLIGNAIKFTEKGNVSLTVCSSQSSVENAIALKFTVRDTGIGISDEQQQRIFESFEQGDNGTSRRYGGTGLGLTIAKTLIELQGGTISLKSEPGKSTEFSFIIPYKIGTETAMVQPEEKGEPDYSVLSKLNLLIVEDDELNQVVIKDTLGKLAPGIDVTIAANGKLAVEMVQQNSYDMILMDIQMPEMDGYEATRFMRDNLKITIPIIALTASVIRSDLDKCFEAGMNGYIPKPFKRSELLQELIKHAPAEKIV